MSHIRSIRALVAISIVAGALVLGLSIASAQSPSFQRLLPEMMFTMQVDGENADQYFMIASSPDSPRLLILESRSENSGPSAVLEDMDTHDVIASFNTAVTGLCVRLKPGNQMYMLHVSQGSNASVDSFNVLLQDADSANMDCPNIGSSTGAVALGQFGQCLIVPAGELNVNVRSLPSLSSLVIGHITADQPGVVLGVTQNSAWLMTSVDGTTGWVATSFVSTEGNCQQIPVVGEDGNTASTASTSGSGSTGSGGSGDNPTGDPTGDPTDNGGGTDGNPTVIDISDLTGNDTLAQLAGITIGADTTAAGNDQSTIITTGGDTTNVGVDLNADSTDGVVTVQDGNTGLDQTVSTSDVTGGDGGGNVVDNTTNTVNDTVNTVNDTVNNATDTVTGLLGG